MSYGKPRYRPEDRAGRLVDGFNTPDSSLATEKHKRSLRRMLTIKAEVEAENIEVREMLGVRVR